MPASRVRAALFLASSLAPLGCHGGDDSAASRRESGGGSTSAPRKEPGGGGTGATRPDNGANEAGEASPGGGGPQAMIDGGGPGCGLAAAAFCDTFDAPAAKERQGRARELDATRWSGTRTAPQFPTANGLAVGIGPATIDHCRADLPQKVDTDRDTLICDPNDDIHSNHLLVAVAAQNYGQNSYRIRQPFDFADRTGKIVFDAEAWELNSLLGWISVEVTEDPISVPSFAFFMNDEGGVLPRNGFAVELQNTCPGWYPAEPPVVGLRSLIVYRDSKPTALPQDTSAKPNCVESQANKLNHFEIDVSQSQLDIFGTAFSADGTSFGAPQLLFSAPVNLTFTRGYVTISVHNHATVKYSLQACSTDQDCAQFDPALTCASHDNANSCSCTSDEQCRAFGPSFACVGGASGPKLCAIDSWRARWDNVGFDGPVLTNSREAEVADALTLGTSTTGTPVKNIAYRLNDGAQQVRTLRNVTLDQVTSAKLSVLLWYDVLGTVADYKLRYRLNGRAWHDSLLTQAQLDDISAQLSQGAFSQLLDVDISELQDGDNTVEFTTLNAPTNYPPAISNIDLILATDP